MGNHCTEICHYISDTQVMAGTLVYFSLKFPCFLQTHAVSHYWLHVNDDSVFLSMKTWGLCLDSTYEGCCPVTPDTRDKTHYIQCTGQVLAGFIPGCQRAGIQVEEQVKQ